MKYWEKRCDDAMVKLSKIGGDKLLKNNPGITDLSDEDRPMKIGDLMLNVYDNQWSDAIEDIEGGTVHEELAVAILYKILMTAHKLCQTNKQLTDDEKAAMVLKEVENVYDSVKFEEATNVYIKYCTHVCTHMLKQNVPLVFGKPPWPSLFLYEGGPMLSHGAVQLKKTT